MVCFAPQEMFCTLHPKRKTTRHRERPATSWHPGPAHRTVTGYPALRSGCLLYSPAPDKPILHSTQEAFDAKLPVLVGVTEVALLEAPERPPAIHLDFQAWLVNPVVQRNKSVGCLPAGIPTADLLITP